jgi:hypothetical protein
MEVGLWLTSSIVVGWDFFLMGVWQGLSFDGGEKNSRWLLFTLSTDAIYCDNKHLL